MRGRESFVRLFFPHALSAASALFFSFFLFSTSRALPSFLITEKKTQTHCPLYTSKTPPFLTTKKCNAKLSSHHFFLSNKTHTRRVHKGRYGLIASLLH